MHLERIHKRDEGRNWEFALQRARDIINYVAIYRDHLKNPAIISAEYKSHKLQMEQDLGFEELKALREAAMELVADEESEKSLSERRSSQTDTERRRSSSNTIKDISEETKFPKSSSTTSSHYDIVSITSEESLPLGTAPTTPTTSNAPLIPSPTTPPISTPTKSVPSPSSPSSVSPTQSGEGLLQRWFPTWTGWYSSEAENLENIEVPTDLSETSNFESNKEDPIDIPENSSQEKIPKSSLEEEILYVLSDSLENNTFMKRDAVFCKLSFTLKKGTISLLKCQNHSKSNFENRKLVQLFELELASVKMALESRPRSRSYKFDIELGSLCLKDQVTADTAFPNLICQQNRDLGTANLKAAVSRTSSMYAKLTNILSPMPIKSSASSLSLANTPSNGPLFSLTYECKPLNSKADHR